MNATTLPDPDALGALAALLARADDPDAVAEAVEAALARHGGDLAAAVREASGGGGPDEFDEGGEPDPPPGPGIPQEARDSFGPPQARAPRPGAGQKGKGVRGPESRPRSRWADPNGPDDAPAAPTNDESAAHAGRLLGRPVDPPTLRALAGDSPSVRVEPLSHGLAGFTLWGQGPNHDSSLTLYSAGRKGLEAEYNFVGVRPSHRNTPLAAQVLGKQLLALRQMGVRRVTALAARQSGGRPGRDLIGYKVWPKYGFDGPIPDAVRESLPPGLAGARTVQDLYASPGGRAWWEENGDSFEASLDLDSPAAERALSLVDRLSKRGKFAESEFDEHAELADAMSENDPGVGKPISNGAGVDRLGRRYAVSGGERISLHAEHGLGEDFPDELLDALREGFRPWQDDEGRWHAGDDASEFAEDDDDESDPDDWVAFDEGPYGAPQGGGTPTLTAPAPAQSQPQPQAPAWQPAEGYQGKRGRKWVSASTGRVYYSPHQPGSAEDKDYQKRLRAARDEAAKARDLEEMRKPARTTYVPGGASAEEAKEVLAHLAGRPDAHHLIGAPGGSEVEVRVNYLPGGGYQIGLDGKHPAVDNLSRRIKVRPDGSAVAYNDVFVLKPRHRGSGVGARVLADQVREMANAGVGEIRTTAARGGGYSNGYYTWPVLGYDADLTDWQDSKGRSWEELVGNDRAALPRLRTALAKEAARKGGLDPAEALRMARNGDFDGEARRRLDAVKGLRPKSVLDLTATPEGRSVWQALGDSTMMRFDLTPGSRSLQVLNDYLARKGLPPVEVDPAKAEAAKQRRAAAAPELEARLRESRERAERTERQQRRYRDVSRRLGDGHLRRSTPEAGAAIGRLNEADDSRRAAAGLGRATGDDYLEAVADAREAFANSPDQSARLLADDPVAVHRSATDRLFWNAVRERHERRMASPEAAPVHEEMAAEARAAGIDPAALEDEARLHYPADASPDAAEGLRAAYRSAWATLERRQRRGGTPNVEKEAESPQQPRQPQQPKQQPAPQPYRAAPPPKTPNRVTHPAMDAQLADDLPKVPLAAPRPVAKAARVPNLPAGTPTAQRVEPPPLNKRNAGQEYDAVPVTPPLPTPKGPPPLPRSQTPPPTPNGRRAADVLRQVNQKKKGPPPLPNQPAAPTAADDQRWIDQTAADVAAQKKQPPQAAPPPARQPAPRPQAAAGPVPDPEDYRLKYGLPSRPGQPLSAEELAAGGQQEREVADARRPWWQRAASAVGRGLRSLAPAEAQQGQQAAPPQPQGPAPYRRGVGERAAWWLNRAAGLPQPPEMRLNATRERREQAAARAAATPKDPLFDDLGAPAPAPASQQAAPRPGPQAPDASARRGVPASQAAARDVQRINARLKAGGLDPATVGRTVGDLRKRAPDAYLAQLYLQLTGTKPAPGQRMRRNDLVDGIWKALRRPPAAGFAEAERFDEEFDELIADDFAEGLLGHFDEGGGGEAPAPAPGPSARVDVLTPRPRRFPPRA